jgi:hypothetical protein
MNFTFLEGSDTPGSHSLSSCDPSISASIVSLVPSKTVACLPASRGPNFGASADSTQTAVSIEIPC